MYKIKKYYISLLIVLGSGTSFFSQLYYQQFLIFILISSIIINRFKKLKKENIITILFIIPLILVNFFVTEENLSSYIGLFIKLISMMLLLNNIDKYDFYKCYFQILFIITMISIPCYLFSFIFPGYIISHIPLIKVWNVEMRLTPFYNFPTYVFNRNNGLYWEPGAFQAFINVALYFGFRDDIGNIKHKNIKISILIIGLLTTFSTTGYIVFIFVIMNYLFSNITFNKKNTRKIIITFLVILSVFLYFECKFKTISNKFNMNSYNYSSTTGRFLDTKVAFDLLCEKPITGWGYQNNSLSVQIYGVQNVSNQFMVFFEQFGIPISIIFILLIFIGINNISSSIVETVFLIICLLIIFNTENMMLQPLFLSLLFVKKNKKYSNKAVASP